MNSVIIIRFKNEEEKKCSLKIKIPTKKWGAKRE